jgi:hypothetical protein
MSQERVTDRPWERFPELPGALPAMKKALQVRARHKRVRYLLFRLRKEVENSRGVIPTKLEGIDLPAGFVEYFLTAPIRWAQLPDGRAAKIVGGHLRTPAEIGGLATFASRWDVNSDLVVYSRHRTIWQEWQSTLARVVPVLGEE